MRGDKLAILAGVSLTALAVLLCGYFAYCHIRVQRPAINLSDVAQRYWHAEIGWGAFTLASQTSNMALPGEPPPPRNFKITVVYRRCRPILRRSLCEFETHTEFISFVR